MMEENRHRKVRRASRFLVLPWLVSLGCGDPLDRDGDGIPTPGDCDDKDPEIGYELFKGDLGIPLFAKPHDTFTDFCAETSCYREVTGSLFLAHASPENLLELHCLASVQKHFAIVNNNSIFSLEGLNNLSDVGESFYVNNSKSLLSLKGLDSLSRVGFLNIYATYLESLDGLETLTRVDEAIYIDVNIDLTNIDALRNLEYVGGNVVLANNPLLCESDAEDVIEEIDTIEGNVQIGDCYGL